MRISGIIDSPGPGLPPLSASFSGDPARPLPLPRLRVSVSRSSHRFLRLHLPLHHRRHHFPLLRLHPRPRRYRQHRCRTETRPSHYRCPTRVHTTATSPVLSRVIQKHRFRFKRRTSSASQLFLTFSNFFSSPSPQIQILPSGLSPFESASPFSPRPSSFLPSMRCPFREPAPSPSFTAPPKIFSRLYGRCASIRWISHAWLFIGKYEESGKRDPRERRIKVCTCNTNTSYGQLHGRASIQICRLTSGFPGYRPSSEPKI